MTHAAACALFSVFLIYSAVVHLDDAVLNITEHFNVICILNLGMYQSIKNTLQNERNFETKTSVYYMKKLLKLIENV